jgi:hypothetical protein
MVMFKGHRSLFLNYLMFFQSLSPLATKSPVKEGQNKFTGTSICLLDLCGLWTAKGLPLSGCTPSCASAWVLPPVSSRGALRAHVEAAQRSQCISYMRVTSNPGGISLTLELSLSSPWFRHSSRLVLGVCSTSVLDQHVGHLIVPVLLTETDFRL